MACVEACRSQGNKYQIQTACCKDARSEKYLEARGENYVAEARLETVQETGKPTSALSANSSL